ncbi:hypothetical protein [uncultured Methanobrevibacter sp.]|uniref:hypothetical protein n=1 Tax=uncultured Methanobrevibacter sp. TaxID=253161 RepID=UPI0025F7DA84|nr:hypothetical protein [uncultured Methanobrevibacter sp.]
MARFESSQEDIGRRLHYDNEDAEIYDRLKDEYGPFKGATIIDIFSIALIYGLKQGYRTELLTEGSSIGRVVESVIDNSNLRYLMMAVAVSETGSLDTMLDVNEYFTISEEYAKTGLKYLEDEFINNDEELLDDMEYEMLEIYEEFSKKLNELK